MNKPVYYCVYDKDLHPTYWVLRVDIISKQVTWNNSIYIPTRFKELYIKKHISDIILTATKI